MKKLAHLGLLLIATALLTSACVSKRDIALRSYRPQPARDNKPSLWLSDHPEVRRFRAHYMRTNTVQQALQRARRYLPTIVKEFRRRNLPTELAYLPMLESLFRNRANSGHAKGMWQFTPQTAKEMGLRVGFMVDERLNWRKATRAAADYLNRMGARFNYNWALALAAYNGGPNYLDQEMRRQHEWNFWRLRLRTETAEYVPRFIAMLQVAREKYPHMLVALR
ncbi:MAG: lytic transglycosylase domain-containing protein [SAR324 cluster bacterium]|nr:lytic transglycosylase domain-containing protein [SAR324 cluster bacterium]MCZ6728086.1 lytic transglycosylase domain-containing protein [SAR324 cluster bacterium]